MSFNHFDYVPSTIDRRRSVFKFDKPVTTSAYIGYLYPICKPERMMPGSTISLNISAEVRSGGLVAPLADPILFDCFSFFVPNRIVWEHWKQFLGAIDDVLFNNLTSYSIPSFKYGNRYSWTSGQGNLQWNQTIACHFGLQYPGSGNNTLSNCPIISALPFRGYTFIWNEYFRPEQIVAPQNINKTDNGWQGMNMDISISTGYSVGGVTVNFPTPVNYNSSSQGLALFGGAILPVYRAHRNLWLSCLPSPSLQTLNLLANLQAPVGIVNATSSSITSGTTVTVKNPSAIQTNTFGGVNAYNSSNTNLGNMKADLSQALLTVNNYRETIMLQNYYDVLNRAGSRYDEILFNIFGTRTSNAVTDIPELITHKRFTIYRKEVVALANSQDAGGNTDPIGTQAAYIDTVVHDDFFTRSTTEHGYIHMMFAIRPAYVRRVQGIEPEWMQLGKMDQYYPQFDGMGDVSRKSCELFWDYTTSYANQKDIVFGYQEYGAEWKYQRAEAQGFLDLSTPDPILGYTMQETLSTVPTLSDLYVSCFDEMAAFANCLAIPDPTLAPQFVVDIHLTGTISHPMPTYNIPGLGALL